jgi:NADH pyrophosphatase NudC (nudix superfamily)
MSTNRDELKAKLLGQAEAAIDKMLSDERLNEQMTLSDIEAVIGVSEADFRQRALEEIIAMQQESTKTCPLCGSQLRNKGKRKKRVVSLRGETGVERNYYQCERCQKGYFPPR